MCLKNAKRWLTFKFSLGVRLAFFYSIAAFIILIAITIFLYWESINILYRADYQFLSDEIDTMQYIHRKKYNLAQFNKYTQYELAQPIDSIYRHYTRILSRDGKILAETPGMKNVIPHLSPELNLHKKSYRWYTENQINYLVAQAPIKLKNNDYVIMLIALDVSYQHDIMRDKKILSLSLFASLLFSIFIGFIVSYRGIKSLYDLTDAVKKITISSLHQRIQPEFLPKDLEQLGIAFNQMLDRFESCFVRLKQFSSDLAHELRIPINNLIGETEIALSREHTVSEYQQVLISNLEELQRVTQLIENILFLSRAENPQLELQKTSLDLVREINIICDYYEAIADEKNITLSIYGNAHFQANSVMFRRMISNLLSNAIKYTQIGGSIKFIITEDDDWITLKVEDNGIGIESSHLPKIFDRFYRVDAARSTSLGGNGLGLAIVKSIIELHNGKISITSTLEAGTTITIVFSKHTATPK